MSEQLCRGTVEGANCEACPFATAGQPTSPVVSEFPEDPAWLIIGEGPGFNETRQGRCFVGASGQVVNQLLRKIGRDRTHLYVGNATLCVDGATAVRLADGSLGRIDQLVKSRFNGYVQSVDEHGEIVARRVIDWYRNPRGAREMYNVSSRWAQRTGGAGRTSTVMTEDHPILTPEGWQLARDVSGGLIATGDRAPSGNAQQIAWGTLLGDGTIGRGRGVLLVRHAVDQEDYLLTKAHALSGFGARVSRYKSPGGNVQEQIGFSTPSGSWGHAMRALFYPQGKKRIPREVLRQADLLMFAIWYLDDGYMQHRLPRRPSAEICGVAFPEEDLRAASQRLLELGFETRVHRGRIRFGVEASAKFSQAIRRFVHPVVDYKLCPEDRGKFEPSVFAQAPAVPFFDRAETLAVSPRKKRESSVVYCLEVEGTHNFITTAVVVHNCQPPQGSPVEERERAAECCKPRLLTELAWFPGKPILTLGAVAARAIIPKAVLDAIDPPDVPKTKKRAQKEKQKHERKAERKRKAAIEKVAIARFRKAEKVWRGVVSREARRRFGSKPSANYWNQHEQVLARTALWKKALAEAPREYEQILQERALANKAKKKKPPKKKPIKITDIVSTLFDVDCGDGSVRPVIPAIHPAALLHGGGATIGGSHTPDMAYVNLIYDAAKVDALAKGKDIRLTLGFDYEVVDADRANQLFRTALGTAIDEGLVSIDLETYVDDVDRHHALMAYEAKIRVIGVATKDHAIAVAWDLLDEASKLYLQVVLGRVRLGTHHGLYDRTVLRNKHYGYIIPIVSLDDGAPEPSDTLYAHHAAFPGNSHKLQTVTAQFFGVGAWKSEFRNQEETLDKLAAYCAKDVGGTHALIPALEVWVKRSETERVYAIDKRMMDIASRMHLHGQPVSRDVNQMLVSTFTRLARDAKRRVEEQATDPKVIDRIKHKLAIMLAGKKRKKDEAQISSLREMQLEAGGSWGKVEEYEALYKLRKRDLDDEDWYWKINNSKHIAAFLQALDVPLTQVTEGGAISTKREVLESLVDVEIVRYLLEYRENEKMKDFTVPIFDQKDEHGEIKSYGFADTSDRIHPIWSIHKISGRWAGTEPMGTSNPPREKSKKVPFGTTLSADAIILNVFCECGNVRKKHDGSHEFRPKVIEYAYRPTTKRQIVCRPGRKLVGFDFCLAKGTLVDTPDGHRPIEDLKMGDYVYSFNWETKRPDCSKVSNKLYTGRQKTMRVVLDNGEEVRCTYNHRWLVRPYGCGRDAIEVEARDLKPGTRLLPLRRSYTGPTGYETLYSYSAFEYTKAHVAVAQAALGSRPKGYDVHHKNENHRDNRPSNLEYKLEYDHLSAHSARSARKQWKNSKTRRKMSQGIKRALEARGGHHGRNNPRWGERSGIETTCPNCGAPTYLGGKHPKRFCCAACYHEFRRKNPGPRGTKWNDLNHKVVAVFHDDLVVPTYDIEVERDHNFALSAGVFVHNSQVEARVIALISGDEFMCDVFASGGDLHKECARVVWKDFDTKTEAERKMARTVCKTLEYATWYGAADEKVWKGLLKEGYNFKLTDVVGSLNTLRKKMSGVIAWQRDTIHRASQPPYILRDFVLGRIRVWPMGQVEASEALNIVPQATGAAIMDTGMYKMDQRLPQYREAFCITQIHDAAAFECWEDDAEAILVDVKDSFTFECTNPRNGKTVSFPIEAEIGTSLAEV